MFRNSHARKIQDDEGQRASFSPASSTWQGKVPDFRTGNRIPPDDGDQLVYSDR